MAFSLPSRLGQTFGAKPRLEYEWEFWWQFVREHGPRTFPTPVPWAEHMVRKAGLEPASLLGASS